jgi:hypothetical protein
MLLCDTVLWKYELQGEFKSGVLNDLMLIHPRLRVSHLLSFGPILMFS